MREINLEGGEGKRVRETEKQGEREKWRGRSSQAERSCLTEGETAFLKVEKCVAVLQETGDDSTPCWAALSLMRVVTQGIKD